MRLSGQGEPGSTPAPYITSRQLGCQPISVVIPCIPQGHIAVFVATGTSALSNYCAALPCSVTVQCTPMTVFPEFCLSLGKRPREDGCSKRWRQKVRPYSELVAHVAQESRSPVSSSCLLSGPWSPPQASLLSPLIWYIFPPLKVVACGGL